MKEKKKLFSYVGNRKLFTIVDPAKEALTEFKTKQSAEIVDKKYYDGIIILDEIPVFDVEDYDIYNEKKFDKYIDDIKRIIRASFEYRRFVNYLRDYMDMNKCSFFENVSNKDTFKIKIELHHSPFTLYDIVLTVFNKRVFYEESLEVEMVAKEVMYIHYFCMVGIIPLAETVHELIHKQLMFIPLDAVFGNYQEFMDIYGDFIPVEAKDKYDVISAQTLVYNETANLQVLQKSPLVVQLPGDDGSGTYKLPKLETIASLMKNRMIEIKNPNQNQISNKDAIV